MENLVIQLNEANLIKLSSAGLTDLLDVPEEILTKKFKHKKAKGRTPLDLLADSKCTALAYSGDLLFKKYNGDSDYYQGVCIIDRLLAKCSEVTPFLEILVSKIGIDNVHTRYVNKNKKLITHLADIGYKEILNNKEIFKEPSSFYGTPCEILYSNCPDIKFLLSFKEAFQRHDSMEKGSGIWAYPLTYLSRNPNKPTIKELREIFPHIEFPWRFNKKFDINIAKHIIDQNKIKQFMFM